MNDSTKAWINGLIGVIIFAGSLPATRIAVADFDPLFLTAIRAVIAALLAILMLATFRQPRPKSTDLPALFISAFGVVIGFPLFTALALQYVSSAHSIVFVGLLPLSTALFAVLRANERPKPLFWLFSVLGAVFVAGYSALGNTVTSLQGDLLMLVAIVLCGLGYAEGARVSRTLGGWQVICWALLLAFPFMLLLAIYTMPITLNHVSQSAWFALGYVSIFSMFLGFVFWYRGLAQGGIAAVGQLQLLQPFIGLALAAWLLGENVTWGMLIITMIAVLCVAASKKYA